MGGGGVVPAAIFACTFMKTLFTSAPTANRTLMVLIYTIEINLSQGYAFFKDISCFCLMVVKSRDCVVKSYGIQQDGEQSFLF